MSFRKKSAEFMSQAVVAVGLSCMYIVAALVVLKAAKCSGMLPEQNETQCVCDCGGGGK